MLVTGYYRSSPKRLKLHHFLVMWLPPINSELTSVEVTHAVEHRPGTKALLLVPAAVIATRRIPQKMTSGD